MLELKPRLSREGLWNLDFWAVMFDTNLNPLKLDRIWLTQLLLLANSNKFKQIQTQYIFHATINEKETLIFTFCSFTVQIFSFSHT